MSLKENNEITVKIKCELDECHKNIEEKDNLVRINIGD